jgi:hypothetical protein
MNPTPNMENLPVTVSGQWLDGATRNWQGVACASQPLVALIILAHGNVAEWCKSERQSSNAMQLRLALFPYEKSGCAIQVNFFAGNAHQRYASVVESESYKPRIKADQIVHTGQLVRFSIVEGVPRIDLKILLLPQRVVKFGRKALWHPRSIMTALPEHVGRMLESGRSGTDMIA